MTTTPLPEYPRHKSREATARMLFAAAFLFIIVSLLYRLHS